MPGWVTGLVVVFVGAGVLEYPNYLGVFCSHSGRYPGIKRVLGVVCVIGTRVRARVLQRIYPGTPVSRVP